MHEKKENLLFPYNEVRPIQDELIKAVYDTIKNKKNLIVHAPTGLGKTAATLAPALSLSLNNKDTTIFFLTSRHTQHNIAIETLKHIKEKHGIEINAVDIVGKQSMCIQSNIQDLYSNEFNEYCKSVREKGECEFYTNTKDKSGKLTVKSKKIMDDLRKISPSHSEKIIEICEAEKLCPYEISSALARTAKIIIADYFYIFHPIISDAFFKKTGKKLEESIVIVDEGHNLPDRIRKLFSQKTSTFVISRAIKEAKKFHFQDLIPKLRELDNIMKNLSYSLNQDEKEKIIVKREFLDQIQQIDDDYDQLIADLEFAADEIREKQRSSFIGGIATFLNSWQGPDKGFSRILTNNEFKNKKITSLSYRCLDPSLSSTVVVEHSYSTILMSGTLKPTDMYRDLLGFPENRTVQREFKSPFPKKNKLTLIVPETTTKFTQRSDSQFQQIAKICSNITNKIQGNTAIFLPSYFLMDQVNKYFSELSNKRIIREIPGLSKEGKHDLLEEFKSESKKGAVLLGVAAGSFGEGVDLPGDLLKCVIIVGIPLQKPDLETNELINYYDQKFKHGWDYAYLYPAILKSMQNAGRCIRSEKDKGVIVFLDERYAWTNYKKCFEDSNIKITKGYLHEIDEFFKS
jgi:DNA excision repair protein ERCC-2